MNTNNRITNSGFTYDAAGDLLTDGTGTGTHAYTWDAEGRVSSATPSGGSATNYTYNALGQRVRAAGSTFTYDYPYDAAGENIGLFNAGGASWSHYQMWIFGRPVWGTLLTVPERSRRERRRTAAAPTKPLSTIRSTAVGSQCGKRP